MKITFVICTHKLKTPFHRRNILRTCVCRPQEPGSKFSYRVIDLPPKKSPCSEEGEGGRGGGRGREGGGEGTFQRFCTIIHWRELDVKPQQTTEF